MVEYLVSFVQSLCLIGYLYGAWLVITHKPDSGPHGGEAMPHSARSQAEDDRAWRRYLAW